MNTKEKVEQLTREVRRNQHHIVQMSDTLEMMAKSMNIIMNNQNNFNRRLEMLEDMMRDSDPHEAEEETHS